MANPPLAVFGNVDPKVAIQKDKPAREIPSKYKELMTAIHTSLFNRDNLKQQTRVEWDNIEGEVMGMVLSADLMSGTMMIQITHPLFAFASPTQCLDKLFTDSVVSKYIEVSTKKPHLFPSITVMNDNLNELLVSYKGLGRQEMVQMIQALQVSMQEQDRSDPLRMVRR